MPWNERHNLPMRPCEWCGTLFKPATDSARYHSPTCRGAANNAKLAKKREKVKNAARKKS